MTIWNQIEQDIYSQTGTSFFIKDRQRVDGGSINNTYKISDEKASFFVKTNRKSLLYMFEAESKGLDVLFSTNALKVPKPIHCGVFASESYLIMNWLEMSGQPDSDLFGQKIACLHQSTAKQYGFFLDNTIGSTPQLNQWSDDWTVFWKKQRLGYQLDLAKMNGFSHRLYDQGQLLIEKVPLFFKTYQPLASLLHGDLWGGNWAGDTVGQPVIFDPACYYGDREADLAMMELFSHPGRRFFDEYNDIFPVDDGYSIRKNLYNLYHVLNHANLFGGSYTLQAENMIESLLAEVNQ